MTPDQLHISLSEESIPLSRKLETLPTAPGVYQFKDETGTVLYVGKAINLRNRVRQYFQKSRTAQPRIDAMVAKAADAEIIVTDSEVEALILEATLIKKLKPRYNVDLKDDKSYPYIVVTHEPYPRVFVTRRVIRDGSRYFGPYTDVGTMRESLKMVREIFKVRSCNFRIDEQTIAKRKVRVCLDYHIKKCDGPCEGLISYAHYHRMIQEVMQVLKGKTAALVGSLTASMQGASAEMRFEEAAQIRDRIRQLSVYRERQKVVDPEDIDRDLVAVEQSGDSACGVVFSVREGKIIGRRHVYMAGAEGVPVSLLTEHFLERFYLESEDIPREIYLAVEIDHPDLVTRWLTERRKENVSIVVPKIGEKAKLVAMCRSNAKYLLDDLKLQKLKRAASLPKALTQLQKDLRLQHPLRKIECFDISNIQGTDSVASMVVFVQGKPRKSEYRKFKLRSVSGPDDFASMREVVERRYTRLIEEQQDLPDLIVVDGGKGQLSSAVDVIKDMSRSKTVRSSALAGVPIIGLAKRLEEVYVPNASEPLTISRSSPGLKLLQRIRDEAHRFAITYHRSLRAKRTLQTELDLIKGIGKKRATELLEAFGSVQGVKFANVDQLAEIVGDAMAEKIREYFDLGQPGNGVHS